MSQDTLPLTGWGRFPLSTARVVPLADAAVAPAALDRTHKGDTVLPYGLGRSYGDSCLNDGHTALLTRPLDKLLAFDSSQGLLTCQAGVSFAEVLQFAVPRGWFLPVTPGTKFVTVGGAIANDVHGKNHHVAGNFGNHVTSFELVRSDGRYTCSPAENPELFRATIGGLGLTGLITQATFRLKPITSVHIDQEVVRYSTLDEFFALSAESEASFEYTVSWIDCFASGRQLGRGHFIRGNHSSGVLPQSLPAQKRIAVPVNAPGWLLNSLSLRSFNLAYYWRQPQRIKRTKTHYDPFFYPLDAILNWNRIYGKRGLLQYQCVLPMGDGSEAIKDILKLISQAQMGSFLAVLKTFGAVPSVGLMSFPRHGVTLALDFPNCGDRLFKLLAELDNVTRQAGGAVYPAKDARMSPASFAQFFPQFSEFSRFIDPHFSSSFLRRVQ